MAKLILKKKKIAGVHNNTIEFLNKEMKKYKGSNVNKVLSGMINRCKEYSPFRDKKWVEKHLLSVLFDDFNLYIEVKLIGNG